MNRFIRLRLLAMILCLPFLLIFISGCGSSSQKKDEPPVYSPLQVLVPEATGKETLGSYWMYPISARATLLPSPILLT